MARYQIWNGTDTIITPGAPPGESPIHTPEQWTAKYPWVGIPGAKMIITGGNGSPINGGCALEFIETVTQYKNAGADIPDDWFELNKNGTLTDEQILAAIEDFEDNPPVSDEPSFEERIAAALEFQALNSLPDEN